MPRKPSLSRQEAMDLIRKARVNRGLSKSDAARLAGMRPSQWNQSENPKRRCRPETIVRMAAAVGLRLEFIPEGFDLTGELLAPGIIRGFGHGRRIDPVIRQQLGEN